MRTITLAVVFLIASTTGTSAQSLAQTILADSRLDAVAAKAKQLLRAGFSAGAGIYSPIFIRDYNTFLPVSCEVLPARALKAHLLPFLLMQSADGGISDAYEDTIPENAKSNPLDGVVDPKGTVESDQESSLVQAVSKYVACTHDAGFLNEKVGGVAVLERLNAALDFVKREKLDARYGLVTSGTAIDWGDVQAEDVPGGSLNANSHLSMSIYANAMYLIALDNLAGMLKPEDNRRQSWLDLRQTIAANARRYLWDEKTHKFVPHLYTASSPFPPQFDENAILFEGGTALAIEAGLLSDAEISEANAQMIAAQRKAGAFSIAGSIYPPYPLGYFKHPILCEFCYQNGGIWPWFAGRMVRQLALHGMIREAYDELQPLLDQAMNDGDFFEWYTLSNKPSGAPNYRGGAGVLAQAIEALQTAALAAHDSGGQNFVNRTWSYADLPPDFSWTAQKDAASGDTVYYGVSPADVQPPLSPGDTVYVGPDSAFYYFKHPPPIRPSDLGNRWTPLRSLPVPAGI